MNEDWINMVIEDFKETVIFETKYEEGMRCHYQDAVNWLRKILERNQELLHQELQKARHDWLREEIVKLEGEKLGGLARPIFVGANAPERMRIHNEALQTIIDRYQSELDQHNK